MPNGGDGGRPFDVLCEDAGIDLEAAMRRAKANPVALPEFDPDVDGLVY